jgi:transketolase
MVDFSSHVSIGEPTLPAKGIAKALRAAAEKDRRVVAILEDMGFPDIEWWTSTIPERMVEVGISEQNGAVVAAALASEGFIPVINSFLFANVGRAYNQVRQSILVDRFNVKIIGREGAWGEVGISHNTIENLGACRVLPNLVILNPADVVEAEKATEAMMQYVGPVVLRQESSPTPPRIFTDDYPFDIGKGYFLREGSDATIIATGYMLSEAITAVGLLEEEGLDVGLLDLCTVKPLDEKAIVRAARSTGAIVTAENASIIGGLGEGVGAVLAERFPTPLVRVGVDDEFSQSGLITPEKDELKEHFALGAGDLAEAVRQCLEKKESLGGRYH